MNGSMDGTTTRVQAGLDGVVAAETRLSHVDGTQGTLLLAGRPLAGAVEDGFEATAARLWRAVDGTVPEADALRAELGAARLNAFQRLPLLLPGVAHLPPVDALRVMIAALPDADTEGGSEGSTLAGAIRVVAAAGVLTAALARRAARKPPIAPEPALGHVEDILRMSTGHPPGRAALAGLDAYLTTAIDHGLNASTFAARVVASTRAGMVASVTAALGALKGPLHGGAPGPVLDMLDAIGRPEAAPGWIDRQLREGSRLMGFGHRIYRVRDPRADVLKPAVAALESPRIRLAEAVEREAVAALARHRPGRRLDTNLEFWTALLLDALDFDRGLFTPVFACGRMAGWSAHVLEQERTGRLIRPLSAYVGEPPAEAA